MKYNYPVFGRVLFVLISTFLLMLTVSPLIQARLAVAPLSLKLDVKPGETATADLTVHNTGQSQVEVNVRLVDWWRTPGGNLQLLAPGTRDRSCAEWLLYSPNTLTMKPGERKRLTVEVEVPEEAEGDHWAMLLVTERPKAVEEEQPVTTRITVNYAVTVLQRDPTAGGGQGKITNIELTGGAEDPSEPLSLSVRFKNTGPVHLQTTGRVEIRNLQGETVRSIDINKFPTLPGEEHVLSVETPEETSPLETGTYYAIVVMDFGGDHLVQGGLPLEIGGTGPRSD